MLKNKIEARDRSIFELLKDQKFYIDYFQREYRWKKSHIESMVEDLVSTFFKSYKKNDDRPDVAKYQSYYLGPVVFSISEKDSKKSIIDGQQRMTSITLLLIYLVHLQKGSDDQVGIDELIYSEKYGEKSFNMSDKEREECLTALYENGEYNVSDNDDETVGNIVDRYADIVQVFPDELMGKSLPFFIDWLVYNVVLIEITAYSDDNAYMIFETMNDRGLNLTPTEMLKGFVLSRITNQKQRVEMNELWRKQIKKLHEYTDTADLSFFQAWFRSKYAQTIRPGKAGSENKDFELIGSRFHSWFKDNHRKIFDLKTSDDFYNFFKKEFPFYVKCFLKSWDAQDEFDKKMPHLHYASYWGIAESLQDPLLLASINMQDNDDVISSKMDMTARFIETFTVRRSVNFKKFGQTAIKYTMFNIMKLLRDNTVKQLSKNLMKEVKEMEYDWSGVDNFGLHGQNKKFVKHLLARITSYCDELAGKECPYHIYQKSSGKAYEIEHLWNDNFSDYKKEFDQESEFVEWRNSIGALVLLPNGKNQSFGSDKYKKKLKHYLKENTYAQTLHPDFYQKNPVFKKAVKEFGFKFKPHDDFLKKDVVERQSLVKKLCEEIWSVSYFKI